MSNEGDLFLWICKDLYFKDIHPLDLEKSDNPEYQKIIELGRQLLAERGLQDFLGFLLEMQYRINKWAAFIALEYGQTTPTDILKLSGKETVMDHCINIVTAQEINALTHQRKNNGLRWAEKIRARY